MAGGGLLFQVPRQQSCIGQGCVAGGGLLPSAKCPGSKVDCIRGCCMAGGGLLSSSKCPVSEVDCIGGCCVAGGGLLSCSQCPISKVIVSVDAVWQVAVYCQAPQVSRERSRLYRWMLCGRWRSIVLLQVSRQQSDCIGGCCVAGGGLLSSSKCPISKVDCICKCCVADGGLLLVEHKMPGQQRFYRWML